MHRDVPAAGVPDEMNRTRGERCDEGYHVIDMLARGEWAFAVPRFGKIMAQAHGNRGILVAERLHLRREGSVIAVSAVHQDDRRARAVLDIRNRVAVHL